MTLAPRSQTADGRDVIWEPLPTQAVALASTANDLLFGGSKSGGKSDFLVMSGSRVLAKADEKWRKTGIKQMKCRFLIFRKNVEDARDLVNKTHALYPTLDPGAVWHEKERYWRFTSGASVEIRHLDGPRDHEAYNGNEFTWLCFDEVQFISWEAFSYLSAQVRSSDPDYRKLLGIRCTANPGGPHGDWVRQYWHIDTHPQGGKVFEERVKNRDGQEVIITKVFLRSFLRDNKHVDPDGSYEARMRGKWSPEEVRMYLDGDFDCVAGALFSHLLRPAVHFQRSRPLPATWDYMFSIDWGASSPACCHWAACDPDNRIWIIDELHQPGITGSVFGEAMRSKYKYQTWSKGHVWKPEDFWGVIDRQAMDIHGGQGTAGDGIRDKGFRIFPADKGPFERVVGINQLRERLLMDRFSQPQMVIFEDRCPHLVRALKSIQSVPEDPENYPQRSPFAHALDAARFICQKWPIHPMEESNPVDEEVRRWNDMLSKRKAAARTDNEGYSSGYD